MCDDEKLAEFIQNNKSQVVSKAPQPKRAGHKFLRIAILAAVAMCICAVAASALEINDYSYANYVLYDGEVGAVYRAEITVFGNTDYRTFVTSSVTA